LFIIYTKQIVRLLYSGEQNCLLVFITENVFSDNWFLSRSKIYSTNENIRYFKVYAAFDCIAESKLYEIATFLSSATNEKKPKQTAKKHETARSPIQE